MLFIFLYTFGGDFLSCLFYPILRIAFLLFDFYYYPLEACLFISKGQRGADLEGSWGATKRHREVKQHMDMLYEKNAFS